MKHLIVLTITILFLFSCSDNGNKSDAYGNFETIETVISAETQGKILQFNIDEGQKLAAGEKIGLIDTIQLTLKKQQLNAQKAAISTKTGNVLAQIEVLEEQKATLLTEKKRVEKLLKDGAATQKQMDDINGQISIIEKKIQSVRTQNASILSELKAMEMQIKQLEDQIKKSVLTNPVEGIVLEKYVEPYEIAVPGKSLYKIADISELMLRIYVSGSQLPHIKIGQNVEVLVDKTKTENQSFEGEIVWISEQAEFTPKIIQTKEERVDLVYAVKVKVKNNGTLKIGMPGEVNF